MKSELFDSYVDRVCNFYRIDKDKVFTKYSGRESSDARHMIWWLSHKRRINIMYIKKHTERWGLKVAHSTISHGVLSFESKIQKDDDLIKIINNIENTIKV